MDGWLETDDPLGSDTAAEAACPHCGESMHLLLDPGGGAFQDYIEDCQVCCRPCLVRVRYDADGGADVQVEAAD